MWLIQRGKQCERPPLVRVSRRHAPAPVGPRVGVNDPAIGAHHARAERRHRHAIRPGLGADHRLMAAKRARDHEGSHAMLAHIAERHRNDRTGVLLHDGGSEPCAMPRGVYDSWPKPLTLLMPVTCPFYVCFPFGSCRQS
jgi:hypothetical protein